MTGLPTIHAEGTLVGDPELRFTPSGVALAKWRIACNERVFNKNTAAWENGKTTFITGSCWRTLAENTAETLRKGDLVVVVGVLTMREWEAEGTKRTAYEIEATSMGPALTFTSATLTRTTRTAGKTDDPWTAADNDPPF